MSERVDIKMLLDVDAYKRHALAVKTLVPDWKQQLKKNDLLKVSYSFWIKYYGNVAEKLAAVAELCDDPEILKEVDCAALEEGRILVYEALKRLDAVIRRL